MSAKKVDDVHDAEILPAEAVIPASQIASVPASTPMMMIDKALAAGASIEVLERLMDLQERHEGNAARKAYNIAIAGARAEIPVIAKTGAVDYTNQRGQRTHFKHETLAGIASVVDPILAKHGLSYRFRTDAQQGGVIVTCIISHEGGYSEETSLPGPMDGSGSKNVYQALGSALTYLQRYTLKAALGLSTGEDDDGMSAAPRGDGGPEEHEPINHAQAQELAGLIQAAGLDESVVLQAEKIDALTSLPASKFADVQAKLMQTGE